MLGANARPAEACSFPPCVAFSVAPSAGTKVPSNLPAIAVNRFFEQPPPPSDLGPFTIELLDANGSVVPTVSGLDSYQFVTLLRPTDQLSAGSYRLRVKEPCPAALPAGTIVETEFFVGAASPMPSFLGKVSLLPSAVESIQVGTSRGTCVAPITASVAHLIIEPSTEVQPFAAVALYTVLVDGKVWAVSNYGSLKDPIYLFNPRSVQQIHGRCERPDPSYEDDGPALGHHTGELRMHIAGAKSDPPGVAFEFDLVCPDGTGTDGGVAADAGAVLTLSTPACGCSVGAIAPEGRGVWALVLLLNVCWLRFRTSKESRVFRRGR